jgi:hypothetical protein
MTNKEIDEIENRIKLANIGEYKIETILFLAKNDEKKQITDLIGKYNIDYRNKTLNEIIGQAKLNNLNLPKKIPITEMPKNEMKKNEMKKNEMKITEIPKNEMKKKTINKLNDSVIILIFGIVYLSIVLISVKI